MAGRPVRCRASERPQMIPFDGRVVRYHPARITETRSAPTRLERDTMNAFDAYYDHRRI